MTVHVISHDFGHWINEARQPKPQRMSIGRTILRKLLAVDDDADEGPAYPGGPPEGTPPTKNFEGPWFSTQLTISLAIGLVSFFVFSYCRRRWPLLFAPRTKLKGFSPHEAHANETLFGWIMPTLRTSEYTILQIVGLDATVMLNFFKMSFLLFLSMTVYAALIIIPVNLRTNLSLLPSEDESPNSSIFNVNSLVSPEVPSNSEPPGWLELVSETNAFRTLQLLSTYIFTLLTLRSLHKNYKRFIRTRQLYSLELVHSIPARTVMVTRLPAHLQGERALAVYFESMGLNVESVSVCRQVGSLASLLEKRTRALLELEKYWVKYVGNPSTVESYDPSTSVAGTSFINIDMEAQQYSSRYVVPHHDRPTLRPGWLESKVDALEYLEKKFNEFDAAVQKKRQVGKFRSTHVAFVTFETMSSAQIAAQVVTAPYHSEAITTLAPEPRDIIWENMNYSRNQLRIRQIVSLAMSFLLLFFWIFPIGTLASLLSYKEIKRTFPWLGNLIDQSDRLRAFVQHSLPSAAVITLNALLPFILEFLAYFEGLPARSLIEYSIMKSYFLFLLINVIFIFLLVSNYFQVARDLYESPGKIPEKIASALNKGVAKNYFVSYVILQAFGIVPLQLLNLGIIIPRIFYRMFITRSPRDFAELNAPPMINYGAVYPQCILVFITTLLYGVIQPLILIFGTIYFGMSYMVYKYKLLFVFYRPYESIGQAWPITFIRVMWGVVLFQIFMAGILALNEDWVLAILIAPLILFTVWWGWQTDKTFHPLSSHVSLCSASEVQRGEDNEEFIKLRTGHPVTRSQSNLSRRRYAQNDDTLYVAPEDEHTDYSQPPMTNWYYGVLNTGKRRYGHPALTGVLPQPWLPLKKGETLVNRLPETGFKRVKAKGDNNTLVLTLRRRSSNLRRHSRAPFDSRSPQPNRHSQSLPPRDGLDTSNPWVRSNTSLAGPSNSEEHSLRANHRLSFDPASGVMVLPDSNDWLEFSQESESDEGCGTPSSNSPTRQTSAIGDTPFSSNRQLSPVARNSPDTPRRRHGVYFHHPERRVSRIGLNMPGEFRDSPHLEL